MKLAIVLAAMSCVSWSLWSVLPYISHRPRWNSAMATRLLRLAGEHLLQRKISGLDAYVRRVAPILKELPHRQRIDLATFVMLHPLSGVLVWGLVVYAWPSVGLLGAPLWWAIGAILPYLILKQLQARYHTALLKALPDCLEVKSLVMEAGLDLTAALQHYLEKGADSALKPLWQSVQGDLHRGLSRAEAYQALARRTSFLPLRDTCRAIAQGLTLGTPLAPLLREQADRLRVQRMQIAEKKAAEAPIRMLLPLFVFIFPTIFITLLGPIAVMFLKEGR